MKFCWCCWCWNFSRKFCLWHFYRTCWFFMCCLRHWNFCRRCVAKEVVEVVDEGVDGKFFSDCWYL